MRRLPMLLGAALLCLNAHFALPQNLSFGQGQASSSSKKPDAVRYLYPEQVSVPAKKTTVVELHFHVIDGMHINSHAPREKTLIPTNLAVPDTAGVRVTAVDFPPGSDYSFSFSPNEKLSVYSGEFVLKAHITADAGDHLLQAVLRYQACDSNSCYPPKTIPVALDVIAK